MRFFSLRFGALAAALTLVMSLVAVDYAEARRGGSFGSRGMRTFQSAPATTTSPFRSAPVQRSMTPQAGPSSAASGATGMASRRPGLFSGLGGGLLGGLMLGGLFGMLAGTGFGGFGGMLALLVQVALIAFGAMLLIRLFRSRSPAGHGAASPFGGRSSGHGSGATTMHREAQPRRGSFPIPDIGSRAGGGSSSTSSGFGAGGAPAHQTLDPNRAPSDEVGLTDADQERFEDLLQRMQAAFSREDYGALRRITTPEIMSYLAQELSENATSGRKNDVGDVALLQGDIAEAWSEGASDYTTVAMRYESIDVMRDRETGEVIEGDPSTATQTTELWTFVRQGRDAEWLISAIQEA